MSLFTGADFPPTFMPTDVNSVPWGRVDLTFSGPDAARVVWDSDTAGYDDGELTLTRLTALAGHGCSEHRGASIGNLVNDSTWRELSFPVPRGQELTIRFIGDTSGQVLHQGQGFLIDDVRVDCGESLLIHSDGFEDNGL